MLGNHEMEGETQGTRSPQLEPDQEVAAVLGTGKLLNNWLILHTMCCQTISSYSDLTGMLSLCP